MRIKFRFRFVDFKINYTLITKYPYLKAENYECNQYYITQTYSFQSRAHFICKLDIEDQLCDKINQVRTISWIENFVSRLLWIHVIVLILAFFSLFFTFRSIFTFIKMYVNARRRLKKKEEEEQQRRMKDDLERVPLTSGSSDDSIYFNPLFETTSGSESGENDSSFEESVDQLDNLRTPMLGNNVNRKDSLFRHQHQEEEKSKRKKFSPKKHFLFLQFWSTFIVIGNFLQILGAFLSLSNYTEVTTVIG